MEDKVNRLEYQVDGLNKEMKEIKETVKETDESMKERIETIYLLKSIKESIKGLHEDRDKILVVLATHKMYLNMLIGGLIVLQFFGMGDRIKALVMG